MGLIDRVKTLGELYDTLFCDIKNIYQGTQPTKPVALGEKIVVLGNGPSQKIFLNNRNDFKDYEVLCVNSFPQYSEREFMSIKPQFFCAVDSMLTDEVVAKKTGTMDEYLGLRKVLEKVDWKMSIITWNSKGFQINNPYIDVIKINNNICMDMPFKMRRKLYLQNRAMIKAETVAIVALFFSVLFGFKEVALFGVDHDNFNDIGFDDTNQLYIRTWHAYDEEKPAIYKVRGGQGHFIYELYEGYMWTFKAYLELENLAQSVQCNIINYNYKSYVDAFKKSKKYMEK